SLSFAQAPLVKCFHEEEAPLRVVRFNGSSVGKRFYGYAHWHWAEKVDEIFELQQKIFEKDVTIAELQMENDMLKRTNERLEDDVAELAIENTETKEIIGAPRADRKWVAFLVFSWVFFSFILLLNKQ
ncbi:Serine/threonine-protein kinase MRCK gamma, partial [Bienertia sinuspersici]